MSYHDHGCAEMFTKAEKPVPYASVLAEIHYESIRNAMAHAKAHLLSLDFGIGLDSNMPRRGVVSMGWDMHTPYWSCTYSLVSRAPTLSSGNSAVKPLMRVNSLVILPPWSWTFCFALSSSSGEAPDLRVTLSSQTVLVQGQLEEAGLTLTAGMVGNVGAISRRRRGGLVCFGCAWYGMCFHDRSGRGAYLCKQTSQPWTRGPAHVIVEAPHHACVSRPSNYCPSTPPAHVDRVDPYR